MPGCYPTASVLALGPFVDAGVIEREGIVINALSGASGAGRATNERLHFSRLAGNAEAYGLLRHRHTPEIQQELDATVLFTPAPPAREPRHAGHCLRARSPTASRATTRSRCCARPTRAIPSSWSPTRRPRLKDPLGSNLCFVSARVDERTGWLIAMSSLDNLTKGAAGQAIQAWNVATGRDETLGLPRSGVTP